MRGDAQFGGKVKEVPVGTGPGQPPHENRRQDSEKDAPIPFGALLGAHPPGYQPGTQRGGRDDRRGDPVQAGHDKVERFGHLAEPGRRARDVKGHQPTGDAEDDEQRHGDLPQAIISDHEGRQDGRDRRVQRDIHHLQGVCGGRDKHADEPANDRGNDAAPWTQKQRSDGAERGGQRHVSATADVGKDRNQAQHTAQRAVQRHPGDGGPSNPAPGSGTDLLGRFFLHSDQSLLCADCSLLE